MIRALLPPFFASICSGQLGTGSRGGSMVGGSCGPEGLSDLRADRSTLAVPRAQPLSCRPPELPQVQAKYVSMGDRDDLSQYRLWVLVSEDNSLLRVEDLFLRVVLRVFWWQLIFTIFAVW
uniref:Uncharacterized protein n=1 Tax=Setaria viridis TaxID=4556 RepID=A0A4U6ULI8_SETVI|nr:hypothetical protein SEVIR_6G236650v2 [Setaria viridis]